MKEEFGIISGNPPKGLILSKLKCILIALFVLALMVVVVVLGVLLGQARAANAKLSGGEYRNYFAVYCVIFVTTGGLSNN